MSFEEKEIPLIVNQTAGQRSQIALGLEKLLLGSPSLAESGNLSGERLRRILLDSFGKRGLRPHLLFTQGPGDAMRWAAELAQKKTSLVVVAGGDGTVNEVVNGIAGTETTLGVIPSGTGNSFAIELGIPFSIEEAVSVIRRGRVRSVDIGRAGRRFFAMAAGISFDTRVIKNVKPHLKRALGALSYLLQGVLESTRYPFPVLEVESEDASIRTSGFLAIVSNARFYGGYFQPAPHALVDDGLLDVLVMKRKRFWELVNYLIAMRQGRILEVEGVETFTCRRVRISSDPPVSVHVDAEIAGETPCEFECVREALRVIVP